MIRDFVVLSELDDGHLRQLQTLYRQTWWANQREPEAIRQMIDNSDLVFALVHAPTGLLAGFARVLTDRTYKAMIFDLIVDEEYRSQGLGKFLFSAIMKHPDLVQVEHIELYCHPEMTNFYRQWGFEATDETLALVRKIRDPD